MISLNSFLNTKIQSVVLVTLAFFFTFEHALLGIFPVLSVADDAVGVIALLYIILRHGALSGRDIIGLLCCLAVLVIGLLSNIFSGLMQSAIGIMIDICAVFKVFLVYYFVRALSPDDRVISEALKIGAFLSRLVVIIAFVCLLLSQVVDIGMTKGVRFGISSFAFVFNQNAGNFSKLFYLLIPLLIYDLKNDSRLTRKLIILLALITWCSTMRSRAIAFTVCTILALFWFFCIKPRNSSTRRFPFILIAIMCPIALIIGWDQLLFYFTNESQARYNLLYYALVTAQTYFPLGSGFGTYGSNVAAEYYSPLYTQYGFELIWGMSSSDGDFLNDNYWPMVIGQFGLLGLIAVVVLLFCIFRDVLRGCKADKFAYLSGLLLIGYLLLSSVASKSYAEFSSMGVFIYMGIFSLMPLSKSIESRGKR